MRQRMLIALAAAAVAALLPAGAAEAKVGPEGLTIEADQLLTPIRLGSATGEEAEPVLFRIAERSGFFPASMELVPNPMMDRAPTADLGAARLDLTWEVTGHPAGAAALRQVIYPHAAGGPLTYTAPGQALIEGESAPGGWFRAPSALLADLERVGVPLDAMKGAVEATGTTTATPTTAVLRGASSTTTAASADGWQPWMAGVAALGAVALVAGVTTVWRRLRLTPT
jgi:hypothetical protein